LFFGIIRGCPEAIFALLMVASLGCLISCSPEVGSDEWCAEMKEKPKKDWTAQEAADYTKYCIMGMEKE